jgi:hypothetical protein
MRDPARAHPLLMALRDPESLANARERHWDLLLRLARNSYLLAHLASRMEQTSLISRLPAKVATHLRAAQIEADERRRMALWEINRLERALKETGVPVILLKGAAYLVAQLPLSVGRFLSDIDLLAPQDKLDAVETQLKQCGWESEKLDSYDQHYYRSWMHELPPLRYPGRPMEVDVHHTILPRTSRLHPDPLLLWRAARPLDNCIFKVLHPLDMALHSAVHLCYDSDFDNRLRDLVDLDFLFRSFSDSLWDELLERSRRLDLQRPLCYAMRYSHGLLATPIPDKVLREAQHATPSPIVLLVMDKLVMSALLPPNPDHPRLARKIACGLLYLRSHWLRMPPLLLARHLFHKAFISPRHNGSLEQPTTLNN